MLRKLLQTRETWVPLLLRLTLGIVMFPHGAQKVLGWFGGSGFAGTMAFLTGKLGIPPVFALPAICAEFFGSLGLLTGLLTRAAAFGVGITMVVAVAIAHLPNGFFMNWTGSQKGEALSTTFWRSASRWR